MKASLSACVRACVGFGLLFIQLSACQRSSQFRRDNDSLMNDETEWSNSSAERNPSASANTGTGPQNAESIGQPRKRVLVLNFWNDTPVTQTDFGMMAADVLRKSLATGQKVVLPTDVKSEFNTEDFVQGQHVRVAQLVREGRKLGIAVLVIGRVVKITFRQRGDDVGLFRQKQSLASVEVEVKVFDVQGGRELIATSQSGEASANALAVIDGSDLESITYRTDLTKVALHEAMAKVAPEVLKSVEKLAWQGRIAKLIGPKIYINAGRMSGLLSGDILRVLNPGEEIYDPITGALLGKSSGTLKGTLEVVDFIGTDAAVAETHTGGNFREGDLVQLY